jgi:hypothetical protein
VWKYKPRTYLKYTTLIKYTGHQTDISTSFMTESIVCCFLECSIVILPILFEHDSPSKVIFVIACCYHSYYSFWFNKLFSKKKIVTGLAEHWAMFMILLQHSCHNTRVTYYNSEFYCNRSLRTLYWLAGTVKVLHNFLMDAIDSLGLVTCLEQSIKRHAESR